MSGVISSAFAHLIDSNDVSSLATALTTCVAVVENVVADPSKYGTIKASAKGIRSRLLAFDGGEAALCTCGFNLQDEAYVHGSGNAAEDAREARAALDRFERLRKALEEVGDRNPPAAAQDALKLASTYCANAAADVTKRRVPVSSKALQGRLVGAVGGQALLEASGWEVEQGAEPSPAFVCALTVAEYSITLATLRKADAFWAALAQTGRQASGSIDVEGEPEPVPIEVGDIRISALPPVTGLASRKGSVDLQPSLVRSADGASAELYCWHPVSKRWRLVGSMAIPSTNFIWAALERQPPKSFETGAGSRGEMQVEVEVDLGDGKPTYLGVAVDDALQLENEYLAAKRFIDEHFESLNNNHLEPIARKVRGLSAPLLQTIRNLKRAMEEQN